MKHHALTFIAALAVLLFSSCSDDDTPAAPIEIVIEGAAISPEVGGSNEPNQVYIDLSTETTTTVKRDSWDLGFYAGSEFQVIINGALYMAVAALTTTDIDAVNSTTEEVVNLQPQVAVGTYEASNAVFIDNPNGQITSTAIATIEDTDENNPVYLLNLGKEIGTTPATTGSANVSGDDRGWKKIRILKSGADYILQFANLEDTTHQEVTITKDSAYNFSYFSFTTETIVSVEPEATKWDLNFTVFTDIIEGFGSYGYADYVTNNIKANVSAYIVDTTEGTLTYDNFTLTAINPANFLNDQRGIGSTWRNGGGPSTLPSLKEDVFFVLRDTDDNYYKIKFLALTNEAGERGNPEFIYSLLQ
ncbi:HmuY family protein [Cellulophaga sp. E16_2]|uniref:HmuY family protein n=1 Tax=Cellulophaga sp. E16_2 TaxID=2789297 RepID=UPI001A92A051|nr:HmuY family protein [Cellulophaga sp. E16_2]MBO0591677.1 HmuY family protein [Cellulophaga sp. E16_2]